MMADKFDASSFTVLDRPEDIKLAEEEAAAQRLRESVMSPYYRPRFPIGAQEVGGLLGSVAGGMAGAPGGTLGVLLGSSQGALAGGAVGEFAEQAIRQEPISPMDVVKAGFEEAAWDVGGNLVLKGLGKTFRFGADALGFGRKDIPDPTQAAQRLLEKYGSSLPVAARTGDNLLRTIQEYSYTPITKGIFEAKQKEIDNALMLGSQDVLKSLAKSPEFDYALRTNVSAQRASGEILQNFIKEGQDKLGESVGSIYKEIFSDVDSKISTFGIKAWANSLLTRPGAKNILTEGQQSVLKNINTIPNTVDINTLHEIRSRYLAENRDKYTNGISTEKDSRASTTITELIKKLDSAMDSSAAQLASNEKLNPATYQKYKTVTNTYREGIQALNTDAVVQALQKNPEEVGSYLFRAGNETPILDLYKSAAAAGKLNNTSSKEVLDALRYGYIESMISSPNGLIKLGDDLSVKGSKAKNTYDILMANTPQDKVIKDLLEAAKLGNIEMRGAPGVQMQLGTTLKQGLVSSIPVLSGVYFLLPPDAQQKAKDTFGTGAVVGGALILTNRQLAKAILDPKTAKSISYLSKMKESPLTPSGFTKLVVEPLYNILAPKSDDSRREQTQINNKFDTSKFVVE